MAYNEQCADTRPHDGHTWSGPKSDGGSGQEQHWCSGVAASEDQAVPGPWETAQCPNTAVHANHVWTDNGVRKNCPGVWPRASGVAEPDNS